MAAAVREAARARGRGWRELCGAVGVSAEHSAPGDEPKLHLTRAMRVQPDWPDVEIAWDNCRLTLERASRRAGAAAGAAGGRRAAGDAEPGADRRATSGAAWKTRRRDVAGLARGMETDDPQRVVWLETDRQDGGVDRCRGCRWTCTTCCARGCTRTGKTVILTGATLRTQGGFAYLQQRLGLEDCETLALGSPFDYRHAALVLVPRDMPEPQYADLHRPPLAGDHRAGAGVAAGGRWCCSPRTRRCGRRTNRGAARCRTTGSTALAQGIDGSPRQLVRALLSNPQTVLLGTSSFWEGVDIPGDALSLLVIARLPFAVPTDPVYAARAALYDDAFNQYALPQAVIRFKQGFGRLIRTKQDRGVLVVLDQRIVGKEYGRGVPAGAAAVPRPAGAGAADAGPGGGVAGGRRRPMRRSRRSSALRLATAGGRGPCGLAGVGCPV